MPITRLLDFIDHPRTCQHEAIYRYLYDRRTKDRQELVLLLRRAHRQRPLKGIGRQVRKTKIPNRIPIEARQKSS